MIRLERHRLAMLNDSGRTSAETAAIAVKAGESVRVVDLGTLTRGLREPSTGDRSPAAFDYRLTLTAAVAKGVKAPTPGYEWDAGPFRAVERDVRHLVRALGAPVEVYGPSAYHGVRGTKPKGRGPIYLITTVQP